MTSSVFNYNKLLRRPKSNELTPWERRLNKRVPPPQEELAAMFGYDNNIGCLFYIEQTGATRYVSYYDFDVTINGKRYPQWRVKSMLLLGNPDCVPPNYTKLKEFNPPNKPMAPIPPEKLK